MELTERDIDIIKETIDRISATSTNNKDIAELVNDHIMISFFREVDPVKKRVFNSYLLTCRTDDMNYILGTMIRVIPTGDDKVAFVNMYVVKKSRKDKNDKNIFDFRENMDNPLMKDITDYALSKDELIDNFDTVIDMINDYKENHSPSLKLMRNLSMLFRLITLLSSALFVCSGIAVFTISLFSNNTTDILKSLLFIALGVILYIVGHIRIEKAVMLR